MNENCKHFVSIDYQTGTIYTNGNKRIGDCGSGCCELYKCPICEETFWVEYPD